MGGIHRDRSLGAIVSIFRKLSQKDLEYLAFHQWEDAEPAGLEHRIIKDSAGRALDKKEEDSLARKKRKKKQNNRK